MTYPSLKKNLENTKNLMRKSFTLNKTKVKASAGIFIKGGGKLKGIQNPIKRPKPPKVPQNVNFEIRGGGGQVSLLTPPWDANN